MKTVVEPVAISPQLHKILIDASHELTAVNKMIDLFQKQVTDRIARAEQNVARAWQMIQAETKIDMENIQWVPSDTKPEIIAVAMKLQK